MIVFFIVATLILGGLILLAYRLLGGEDARKIDWSLPLEYPPAFGIAAVLTLLGYQIGLYSYILFDTPYLRLPAFGWVFFAICLSAMWLVLLWSRKNLFTFSAIVAILISGIMMPLRANGFIQSINVVMTSCSSFMLLYIFTRNFPQWQISTMIKEIILFIPLTLIQGIRLLRALVKRDADRHQKILGWFKTAVIALIVLFFFIVILSNADPIFAEIVSEFRTQLFGRAFAAVVIFLLTASLLTIQRENKEETVNHFGWFSYRDISVAAISVGVVLSIFLFIQFKYLFGGSQDLLIALNMTYSEYVRKGFIELLIAAFVGGCISYLLSLKARNQTNEGLKTLATVANIVLLLELMLLLVSAFKRDLLYVDTYGLTRVRVIGGLFLIWLSGFLLLLGSFSLKKSMKEVRILSIMWVLSLGVWLMLNVINIDKKVALAAPGHHLYTDYFYLTQLSEDASEEWNILLPEIQRDTETLLSKDELTEIDKSQLAGLKLALLTLIEKRDRLYLYYAPEEWLLKNGWKIGNQFTNVERNQMIAHDDVVYTVYADSWRYTNEKRGISKSIRTLRNTAYLNVSEKNTYERIAQHEDIYFDEVNKLVRDIRTYQIKKQVPLWTEENRLLYEFTYPFLNVRLRRYYPENLVRSFNSDPKRLNQQVFTAIESTQEWPILRIQTLRCGEAPDSIETYGTISGDMINSLKTPDINPRVALFVPLNPADNSTTPLTIPPEVKLESVQLNKDQILVNGNRQPPQVEYNEYTFNTGTKVFIKAILTPKEQGSGTACTYSFEAAKLTEMLELGGQ